MLSYSKRVILFLIPLFLVALPFIFQYFLFKVSGENSFEFDKPQEKSKLLVGYKYDNYKDRYYKYQIISSRKFDIIGIGSSRVLQFRKEFFKKSFYTWNIINYSQDYLSVLQTLKAHNNLPGFILLQLDERTFNKDFDRNTTTLADLKYPSTINLDISLTKDVLQDYFALEHKPYFREYILEGLAAQYYFSGYREDGSYQYGKLLYTINNQRRLFDSTFQATQKNINSGNTFFNIKFSQASLNNLNDFLDSCTKENIHVICFFQPYPSSVLSKLKETGFYPAIADVHNKVESLLETKTNNHLYINCDKLSIDDDLNLDGIHPNEWSNVNLLLSIPQGSIFREILNEDFLQSRTFASKACLNPGELSAIRDFFDSTKNYFKR